MRIDMKETMELVLSTWVSYWGEGFYQYLLLAAVLYLLIWRRKKQSTRTMVPYLLTALVIFALPLTAGIIYRCIGKSVYWRVLWILPTALVIALAGTELIKERKSRAVQFCLVVLFAAAIGISGKSVWQAGNYQEVNNNQKVPDEVAQICEIVREDAGDKEVRFASDDFVASYARVYDPSFLMPYGRAGRGARMEKSIMLYQEMISPSPDYKKIGKLARARRCNYIAVQITEESQKEILAYCGYQEVGMAGRYGVFRFEKPDGA